LRNGARPTDDTPENRRAAHPEQIAQVGKDIVLQRIVTEPGQPRLALAADEHGEQDMIARRAPRKQAGRKNDPEDPAFFDFRHEHAESIERMGNVGAAKAEGGHGDRRVGNPAEELERSAQVLRPRKVWHTERGDSGNNRIGGLAVRGPGAAPLDRPLVSRLLHVFHAHATVQIRSKFFGQSSGQIAHSVAEGNHFGPMTAPLFSQRSPNERPVLALEIPQLREGPSGRKFFRVSGVDAGHEGFDRVIQSLRTEPARDKGRERFVVRPAPGNKRFGQDAEFAGEREKRRGQSARGSERKGQRASLADKKTFFGLRFDDVALQSETLQKVRNDCISRHHGVRSVLDEKSAIVLAAHRAAGLGG